MAKQTAVEWLFEQVVNLDWKNLVGEKKIEIFEQAKQMEKDQHDKTSLDWFKEGEYSSNGKERSYQSFEQYYFETYKQD